MYDRSDDPVFMRSYLRYAFEFEKYVYIWNEALSSVNHELSESIDARDGARTRIRNLTYEIQSYGSPSGLSRKKRQAFEDEKRHFTVIKQDEIRQYSALIELLDRQEPTLRQNQNVIYARLCEAQQTLQKIYAPGYVHPDFRGMIPIGAMLSYLDTGVCTVIKGHGGIYDLYRREFREDLRHYQIMQQLIQTNRLLAEISSNTRQMVGELRQMNATLEQIKLISEANGKKLANIESNTAAAAVYSRQSAEANSYIAGVLYQKM